MGTSHGPLAMARALRGDAAGAAADHEAVLALCQPRGEAWYAGLSLWTLGLWQQGDLQAATARLGESVQRMRTVNDTLGTAWCLDALACIAHDEDRSERAATLLGAVTRLAHGKGARPALFAELAAHHEQCEQRTRHALGEHAYQAAFAQGDQLSLDEAVAYALDEAPPPAAVPSRLHGTASATRRQQ